MTVDDAYRVILAERQRAYRRANLEKMRAQRRARYAKQVGRPVRSGDYGRNARLTPMEYSDVCTE